MSARFAARRFLVPAALTAALCTLGAAREARADDVQKSGPWMVNAKLGGGFYTNTGGAKQFVLELDAGYAVIGKSGYVILAPQFQFGDYTVISVAAGFQYDFQLIKNLYVYPRVTAGYSHLDVSGATANAFVVAPAVGVKYVLLDGRINVGAEPFNMPIQFGTGGPYPVYRFNAYGGVNF
ncbi:Hypothetical protein A7982_01162 [Minicystis rosea]|nr:Hypothetical protein A7982_01162 [Minicystis rosea]